MPNSLPNVLAAAKWPSLACRQLAATHGVVGIPDLHHLAAHSFPA